MALVRAAVRDRPGGVSPVRALRALAVNLAQERHPLSGLSAGSGPFLRTVASSPALLSRAYELLGEVEQALAGVLAEPAPGAAGPGAAGPEPRLLAALIVAAYRSVVAGTAGQVIRGHPVAQVAADHRRRLDQAFDVLDVASAALGR